MKQVLFSLVLVLFTVSPVSAGLDEGLVVYLTFDNVRDKKILDASGNNLNANVIANADFIKGKYGNAIHIDAKARGDDCVSIPADDTLKIEGEITMMAWVYNEDWDKNSGQWFDKGCQILGEMSECYGMGLFNDNPAGFFKGPNIRMILGKTVGVSFFTTTGPMVDKRWHHITGTYDGRNAKIYLDGKICSDPESEFRFSGTNNVDLHIGCAAAHPQFTFKNGSIDEIGLWRRALTEAEIKEAMKDIFAVSPKDKIATTWGDIKQRKVTH
ncbi:MAG: LamG domain-containing protein [Candidatus Poribacteria bacterium]|nr:LamG domain-containing protein [Candidatus Poribacteria bacterium]